MGIFIASLNSCGILYKRLFFSPFIHFCTVIYVSHKPVLLTDISWQLTMPEASLYYFISVFKFVFLLNLMAMMALGLDISPESPAVSVSNKTSSPAIIDYNYPENFICLIFPSTSSFKTKCQISSPTCSPTLCSAFCTDAHTLQTALFNSASHGGIPSGPLVRRVQVCSLPISHHVSPAGSDLARTQAALGVMNHHVIFLSHMWVKLFDINHTRVVPVWNRRAICPPPVSGCSLCLHPECPF